MSAKLKALNTSGSNTAGGGFPQDVIADGLRFRMAKLEVVAKLEVESDLLWQARQLTSDSIPLEFLCGGTKMQNGLKYQNPILQ